MSDDVPDERRAMGGARGLLSAALAVLAVLGLAACADADRPRPPEVAATTTTTAAGPDGIRDRVVAWEAGRLDADPRRLVVSFTGADPAADPADPCWEGYAPEVSAEPDRVVVRVRAYRSRTPLAPRQFCADMGFVRSLAVLLHNPLAGRAVLDGDGRRHRLAPVPLEPGWLPGGWRLAQEWGQPCPGGRDSWQRSYGPGPDASGAAGGVGVSQVTVTDWAAAAGQPGGGPPPGQVVARAAVRGRAATVEHSRVDQVMVVRWREGRRHLAVSATFPTDPSDREVAALQRLLVRVARDLR
jgi:hypothetical protein